MKSIHLPFFLRALAALLLTAMSLVPQAARAELPDEIQVYTDDINAPGEFGLIHSTSCCWKYRWSLTVPVL